MLAKKEPKQRIYIKISLDGVEIIDMRTKTSMFNHAVTKIAYISRDVEDSHAIGYIYKNSPDSYQYFAIKTINLAQEFFNRLKELFEVVLAIRQRTKMAKKAEAQNVILEHQVPDRKANDTITPETSQTKEEMVEKTEKSNTDKRNVFNKRVLHC